MGTLLCNNIDFLHNNGESIFEKRVKGKIGIYNTREQSDTITYNEDDSSIHEMDSCFFNKVTHTHMEIDANGVDIIAMNSHSDTLDTDVSKMIENSPTMFARLAHDESYKEEHKLGTKAQTRYCIVYKNRFILNKIPSAIIKETYMSDADDPEVLRKKTSVVTTLKGKNDILIFDGTESFIMDTTNMIGDYLRAEVKYGYTADNELIRLHMSLSNLSEDTAKYVIPKLSSPIEAGKDVTIRYIRKSEPNNTLQTEEFSINDDGKLVIKKVSSKDAYVQYERISEYNYEYSAQATSNYNYKVHNYKISGIIDVPTSAEHFAVVIGQYGIPTMGTNPYFDSTYITDPTGQYKRVHSRITKYSFDDKTEYSYYYDDYGIIKSQIYTPGGGENGVECCEYSSRKVIDDEGNYLGTIIESFVNSNPVAKNSTKEYFYRAVVIKEGRIANDYRALMVKDND